MISVHFQGKPFNITVIQIYAPTSNAEEAEVEWFYEDLQDLLELTPPKDVLSTIGFWNVKVGSQEAPGVTGKIGHRMWNKARQRPIEVCQENALVIANTRFHVTEFLSKQSECLHGIQGPTAQGSGETQVAQDSANRDALAFAHHLTEKRSEFST